MVPPILAVAEPGRLPTSWLLVLAGPTEVSTIYRNLQKQKPLGIHMWI